MYHENYISQSTRATNFQICDPSIYREVDLLRNWFSRELGETFATIDGNTICIVTKGTRNINEGPDILNAMLQINDKFEIGDIEFHLDAADWYRHNHHKDPNYDKVILHIVNTIGPNNHYPDIPTIKLQPTLNINQQCNLSRININEQIVEDLVNYGYSRFQRKFSSFDGLHSNNDSLIKKLVRESFYILGAGGNKENFVRIADNINYPIIKELGIEDVEDLLFSLATALRIRWLRMGIRPAQQPHNRMRLAAELCKYFTKMEINVAISFDKFIEDILSKCPSMNGKGIQTEIIGNVIIPFLASRSMYDSDIDELNLILNKWHNLKLPYPYRKFQRRYGNVLQSKHLRSFPILQSLKEIDKSWCQKNHCSVCPLKKIK